MSVGRLLATTIGVLLVLAVVGISLALLASGQLTRERGFLLDHLQPALLAALRLESALINEETGVRGYVITAEPSFLAPYRLGLRDENRAYVELRAQEQAIGPLIAAEVETVRAEADAWRQQYIAPAVHNPHLPAHEKLVAGREGKRLFNAIRASLSHLQAALSHKNGDTRRRLADAARSLELLLIVAAILILGGVLGAGYLLRRTVIRPLARLGSEARRVAAGEFSRPLAIAHGPLEVSEVGAEIDAMRERIVTELALVQTARAQLEDQARELRRSNAELEQFAYVASHDLQEPLRKVASFCQALQKRYQGQLDERADQYIDFAVDGAKRMQALINDLLAFSRVGRSGRELEPLALGDALEAARSALSEILAEAGGAVVLDGELPTVRGDMALLTSVFQNLISNAMKFRGAQRPVMLVSAERVANEWQVRCADNGIGIEPEYAERIFLIFQRLHTREAYDGSGIGLALCRKIVEYHGGRIWLDTAYSEGACFRFTLPIAKEDHAKR
ncbi:MAG TPA: ATP-binding protein [Solirubrobacteraceae bacterium]